MKNLQTSATTTQDPDSPRMAYTDLLAACVNDVGKGINLAEQGKRLEILDVLNGVAPEQEIKLTHDQWAHVSKLYNARVWPLLHTAIKEVGDALAEEMKR